MANDVKSTASATTRPPMTASRRVDLVWQKWTSSGEEARVTHRERLNSRPGMKKGLLKNRQEETRSYVVYYDGTFIPSSFSPK